MTTTHPFAEPGPTTPLRAYQPSGVPGSAPSSTPAKNARVFSQRETTVMRALGLADRDDMRSLREELLIEGEDWAREKKVVLLSTEGVAKLAEYLNLFPGQAAAIALAQKKAARLPSRAAATPLRPNAEHPRPVLGLLTFPGCEPPLIAYVRRRQVHHNRTILIAELPGVGPINIRVRDYANFLPNSPTAEVLVRPGDGHLWEFAGNPHGTGTVPHHPRAVGRW